MTNEEQLPPKVSAWNAVWDKFEGASYDERTAIFYQAIEDGVMDGEMAFEMLNEMYEAAAHQHFINGRRDSLDLDVIPSLQLINNYM